MYLIGSYRQQPAPGPREKETGKKFTAQKSCPVRLRFRSLRWCGCYRHMPHAFAGTMMGPPQSQESLARSWGCCKNPPPSRCWAPLQWGNLGERRTLVPPPSLQSPSLPPIGRAWHSTRWESRGEVCRVQLQHGQVGGNRMNLEPRGNKSITGTYCYSASCVILYRFTVLLYIFLQQVAYWLFVLQICSPTLIHLSLCDVF